SDERRAVGLGRWREALGFELREHEAVDPIPWPILALHLRLGRAFRRHVGPVLLICAPLRDPLFQRLLLRRGQRAMSLLGRHLVVLVAGENTLHERALLGLARHDRDLTALRRLPRALALVEPQSRLAF